MGGLEILVNLLETKDLKCQNGSLSVLLYIVTSMDMKRYLINLGIITPLIQILKNPARDIQVSSSFAQHTFTLALHKTCSVPSKVFMKFWKVRDTWICFSYFAVGSNCSLIFYLPTRRFWPQKLWPSSRKLGRRGNKYVFEAVYHLSWVFLTLSN